EGRVREAQLLGQLANGQVEKAVHIGVDVVQDFLLRPGELPGGNRQAQFHGISPHCSNSSSSGCSAPLVASTPPPCVRGRGPPSGPVTRPPASSTIKSPAA